MLMLMLLMLLATGFSNSGVYKVVHPGLGLATALLALSLPLVGLRWLAGHLTQAHKHKQPE